MIVTFYSYKGGVGRSMALANVADQLARSGLRVLIVDFDLEAPGIEHFFPIDHEEVRGHEGLLDLLLTFKYSMSTAASGTDDSDAFRRLERFVTTVYPPREGGGGLDLLPAGRRLTEDQIGRYGEELRRFDWADFYFTWSGELFFEWLRQTLAQRYDVVLVDSRTGVTEMGGVCAYQLADVIAVLCAPNLQNLEGTEAMVRNFLSPQVRAVRAERPLDLLIVPARVDQQDSAMMSTFQQRFARQFSEFEPAVLGEHDLTFWDLQIPYEPQYAFYEQVITDPGRAEERRGLVAAYGKLLAGIALLAPADSTLASVRPTRSEGAMGASTDPVLTQYDPTTRFAATDVFLSFGRGSEDRADDLRDRLAAEGFVVAASLDPRVPDASETRAFWETIRSAKVGVVLIGPEGDESPWRSRELDTLVGTGERPVFTVVLPGAEPQQIPRVLAGRTWRDLRSSDDLEWARLLAGVRSALADARPTATATGTSPRNPYRGMAAFREADQEMFVGRGAEIDALLDRIRRDGAAAVVGTAGVGKTSLVHAGLVPRLRRGALPDSHQWPVVSLQLGDTPAAAVGAALRALVDPSGETVGDAADDVVRLVALVRRRFARVVLVVDQLEDLFTRVETGARGQFLHCLSVLSTHGRDLIIPVVAIRSDCLDDARREPALAESVLADPVTVAPMGEEELRAVVEVPARRLGLALEPGLTDRLLKDVAGDPGALTLLQFVLNELGEDQRDGYLTHAAYERTGGAAHALATHADAALAELSAADRETGRIVFLELVEFVDEPRRRRPVDLSELTSDPDGRTGVRRVVDHLIGRRLLATRFDPDGELQVELAHETMILQWPVMRRWVVENQRALQARWRLEKAAGEWEALGKTDSTLLSPAAVDKLTRDVGVLRLAAREREFVDTCRRRAQISRQRVISGTTVFSIVTAVLGVGVGLLAAVPQMSAEVVVGLVGGVTGFAVVAALLASSAGRRLALFRRFPSARDRIRSQPLTPAATAQHYPALADDLAVLDQVVGPAFAQADTASLRAQNRYRRQQVALIFGSALLVGLSALQAVFPDQRWPGVLVVVLGLALTFVGQLVGERRQIEVFFDERLKAERLRSTYFRYLSRTGRYAGADQVTVLRRAVIAIKNGQEPW